MRRENRPPVGASSTISEKMATARKQCHLPSHDKAAIWQKIYNVLFISLLLFTTVGSPLRRVYLSWKTQAELVTGTGEHWLLHPNCVKIIRTKSYHHNLAGLYAIYSSVLRNGCATTDHLNPKKQQGFTSPVRKVHSVLLLLLYYPGMYNSTRGWWSLGVHHRSVVPNTLWRL